MRIERTLKNDKLEVSFESVSLKKMKHYLNDFEEQVIENKLETFGSIVKFTYKHKNFGHTFTEEYVICEIGEEENDDVKLAKALRIIYERFAEQVVNNVLIEN